MQFLPGNNSLQTSLLGVGDPPNYLEDQDLFETRVGGDSKYSSLKTVAISAIIFVTIISMYDVLRNVVNYYLTEDIANQTRLVGSITFVSACIIIAFIAIPLLLK